MIDVFRAELSRLTRRRFLAATAVAVLIAVIIATTVVFLSAEAQAVPARERGTSLEELAAAGGGTEAFSLAVSFSGFFVFVVFTANWAGEFTQGTFRTLLMKQPRRLYLLAGKLAGLLAFAAVVLLVAEAATWLISLAFTPTRDVSASAWFSLRGLGEAAEDYANALFGVSAWACFGMALGVLVRSTPLALAVGIAWAGPFEHITHRAWDAASGWYPGLLLERLAVGGTNDVSYDRALTFLAAYVAVATALTIVWFSRRDVTG